MFNYLIRLFLIFFLMYSVPFFATAQVATSSTSLQILIVQLQAQIRSLQAQIFDLNAQIQSVKAELKFTRVLGKGARGDDVKQLQEFLKTFSDLYPEGLITGYFGPLTEMAIKRFQEKQGVVNTGSPEATGFGRVGPKTLFKINELFTNTAVVSEITPSINLIVPDIQKQSATSTGSATSTATTSNPIASTTPSTIPQISQLPSQVPLSPDSPSPSVTSLSALIPVTTITSSSTITDTTAPSQPTSLSASAVSSSQINLSWALSTDNTGVSGYKIYRDGTQISTTPASATSTTIYYSDVTLHASTTYAYTVAAYDVAGNNSVQSASASATTETPPPPPVSSLSAPTNLAGVNRNAWSIDLNWSAPSNTAGITSYAIYRNNTHITDVSVSSSSSSYLYSDVNVAGNGNGPGGVTYTYYLKSFDGQNYSNPSNSVTITNTFTPIACLSASNNASLNYNTQGHVTTVDGNTFTDTCVDRTIVGAGVNLKKAYCDGSDQDPVSSRNFQISVVDCSYGCSGGACNSAPVSMTTSTNNLGSVLAALDSLTSLLKQLLPKRSI